MSESDQHDAVIRLINAFPEVVRTVLTMLGCPPPPGTRVTYYPTNVSTPKDPQDRRLKGTRRHADNALVFEGKATRKWELLVLPEMQALADSQKIARWLQYVLQTLEGANRGRLGPRAKICPVVVMVTTPKDQIVRWAGKAYENVARAHRPFGELAYRPVFVGPKQLPEITHQGAADADPALAALTAAVHPQSAQAAELALRAASRAPRRARAILFAVLLNCTEQHHVARLENMSTEFVSWVDVQRAEARAKVLDELRGVVQVLLEERFPGQLSANGSARIRLGRAGAEELRRVAKLMGSVSATWPQAMRALRKPVRGQTQPRPKKPGPRNSGRRQTANAPLANAGLKSQRAATPRASNRR